MTLEKALIPVFAEGGLETSSMEESLIWPTRRNRIIWAISRSSGRVGGNPVAVIRVIHRTNAISLAGHRAWWFAWASVHYLPPAMRLRQALPWVEGPLLRGILIWIYVFEFPGLLPLSELRFPLTFGFYIVASCQQMLSQLTGWSKLGCSI